MPPASRRASAAVDYIELTVAVAAGEAERAADALRALACGVAIEHPFRQQTPEHGASIERDGVALVRVYVRPDERDRACVRAAAALAAAGLEARTSVRDVAEADWAEAWKEHFHVERYGRIVVVPSWGEYRAVEGDAVIALDPGMAFGTGQHETTRMCLEALGRTVTAGMRVLDVGCGSGILSLAAAKLGAREVVALDVDPDAVRITRENAAANGMDAIGAQEGSLGDAWPLAAPPADFDVAVANIIAGAIIEMAPELAGAVRAGGRVIVSGIIADREGETRAALERVGLTIDDVRAMGEWRCIEARRP
jgi:ribosomal protein L11 methyltransferase